MWKDLGSKWERELISRADIPALKDEDFRQVKNTSAKIKRNVNAKDIFPRHPMLQALS